MSKKLTIKKIRRHLNKMPFFHCPKPEHGELEIPVSLLDKDVCEKITLRACDHFLIVTADLSREYPLPGYGAKLVRAAKVLNDFLCTDYPGSILITMGGPVSLIRWMHIDRIDQVEAAIMGTASLLGRCAHQLIEEINLLPDDDDDDDVFSYFHSPHRRTPFHRPHRASAYAASFTHDAFDDEPKYSRPEYDAPEADAPEADEAAPGVPEFEYDDQPTFDEPFIVSCKVPAGMTKLVIPTGVAGFGPKALCGMEGITCISLPASIKQINAHDFDFLPNLVDIEVREPEEDEENEVILFESIDGVLYRKGRLRELVRYGAGRMAGQFYVPDGVVIIGRRAFSGNPHLRYVVLPDSIWDVHDSAFAHCPWLECAQFNSKDTIYIRDHAFSCCPRLLHVHLVCGTLNIGEHAFEHCTDLFSITLPGDLTLESCTFAGCADLRNVTLTGDLEFAGYDIFAGCSDVLTIHCSANSAALLPEYADRIRPLPQPSCEE